MKEKKYIIFLLIVSMLFCFSSNVYAKQSALERIEEEFKLENEKLRAQEGLTETEFRAGLSRLVAQYNKRISDSPSAALEYLSKGQADTPENRQTAKKYMEYQTKKMDLDRYYADSQGISINELSIKPNYTFSEPIPLVDETYLLAAGRGQMKPEYLKSYIAAWIFVGYADGTPYGVFQVVNNNGAYIMNTVYPSLQQAEAYKLLSDIPECYTASVVSNSKIWYYQMRNDQIEKVVYLETDNPKEEVVVVTTTEVPIYFKAKKIATDKNLQFQIDHPDRMIAGTNGEDTLTYQDAWNRAYYELYIRPYLISAVVVLVLGAVVIIVVIVRKRKQKKA